MERYNCVSRIALETIVFALPCLSCSFKGVGPRFILEVCLTNLSRQEMTKILVTLLCNKKQYSTTPLFERVPILLPLQQETGTASKRLRFIVEAVGTAKTDLQEVKVSIHHEEYYLDPPVLLVIALYVMLSTFALDLMHTASSPQPQNSKFLLLFSNVQQTPR